MYKVVKLIDPPPTNPGREHKKDRFFVCPECKRTYEIYPTPGSKRTNEGHMYFDNQFPKTGLEKKDCPECKEDK